MDKERIERILEIKKEVDNLVLDLRTLRYNSPKLEPILDDINTKYWIYTNEVENLIRDL